MPIGAFARGVLGRRSDLQALSRRFVYASSSFRYFISFSNPLYTLPLTASLPTHRHVRAGSQLVRPVGL